MTGSGYINRTFALHSSGSTNNLSIHHSVGAQTGADVEMREWRLEMKDSNRMMKEKVGRSKQTIDGQVDGQAGWHAGRRAGSMQLWSFVCRRNDRVRLILPCVASKHIFRLCNNIRELCLGTLDSWNKDLRSYYSKSTLQRLTVLY